jgi:hypothetical protein
MPLAPGPQFEWNVKKNRANQRKHGIRFEQAVLIWQRPTWTQVDDREDYGEFAM